jgi:hypothetical protein
MMLEWMELTYAGAVLRVVVHIMTAVVGHIDEGMSNVKPGVRLRGCSSDKTVNVVEVE